MQYPRGLYKSVPHLADGRHTETSREPAQQRARRNARIPSRAPPAAHGERKDLIAAPATRDPHSTHDASHCAHSAPKKIRFLPVADTPMQAGRHHTDMRLAYALP